MNDNASSKKSLNFNEKSEAMVKHSKLHKNADNKMQT